MFKMKEVDSLCIIDDDTIYQFLTTEIIKQTNRVKSFLIFNNGLEAITFLKNNTEKTLLPDIILLDLNMPIMNGWEFLTEYIAICPQLDKKISLYVVSSSIAPSDISKAKEINEVSDFIIKPITEKTFISMIESLE